MEYFKAIRSGTGRNNGAEGDRGTIVHLLMENSYPSWCKALCGIRPRGNGWYNPSELCRGEKKEIKVTCEKCLKKLEKMQDGK